MRSADAREAPHGNHGLPTEGVGGLMRATSRMMFSVRVGDSWKMPETSWSRCSCVSNRLRARWSRLLMALQRCARSLEVSGEVDRRSRAGVQQRLLYRAMPHIPHNRVPQVQGRALHRVMSLVAASFGARQYSVAWLLHRAIRETVQAVSASTTFYKLSRKHLA